MTAEKAPNYISPNQGVIVRQRCRKCREHKPVKGGRYGRAKSGQRLFFCKECR